MRRIHAYWFLITLVPLTTLAQVSSRGSPLKNAIQPLTIPTYEGSGQVVHPDIFFSRDGWYGWKYWLAFTPYPFEKGKYENPSIVVSQDGFSWQDPSWLHDPIDSTTQYANCDPDLTYNPAKDELWLYYVDRGHSESYLKLTTSKDGKYWPKPGIGFITPNFFVSPAIVVQKDKKGKETFHMWAVRTTGWATPISMVELRASPDGLVWSDPDTLDFTQPGKVIWHMDVEYVRSYHEFWALLCCYDSASAQVISDIESDSAQSDKNIPTELYFARSRDGLSWITYSKPILSPSKDGWDSERIYRSTFLYDSLDNRLRIWYSAANRDKVWHLGYAECNFNGLLDYLLSPASRDINETTKNQER